MKNREHSNSGETWSPKCSIAIAGQGPLLDRLWNIVSRSRFKKALPQTMVVAFLRKGDLADDRRESLLKSGLPVFSSCDEMFAAFPDIRLVLEVDKESSYYAALRAQAPLDVNILNSQAVQFICDAIEHGQFILDGAMRLMRLRQSLTTIINNLNSDVIILDSAGTTLDVNDHFIKRLGKKRESLIGKPCETLEGPELCCNKEDEGECPWQAAVRTQSKYSSVYSRVHENMLQYFKIDVFPLPDDGGRVQYILIRDDITDAFQLQQRVQQSEKMAAIGELSTYIAHEIRNPLFAIGGFANSLLRTAGLDPSGREKAAIILEESQRLDGILKSILNFSKPVESPMGEFDLGQVASQTVKIMSMGDGNRHIETKLSIKEGLPHARGNADLVKQSLINLIKNAQEAMPDGGIITVSVRKTAGNLELAVQDTGTGIAPKVLERIFNPFFSTKSKGAGLGLAMTKKLIEDMGGKLEVRSQVGKGTLVRVLLLPALAVHDEAAEQGSVDTGEKKPQQRLQP